MVAEFDLGRDAPGYGADWRARMAAGLALKRVVTAEEAARLAVFLPGDASGAMCGAVSTMTNGLPVQDRHQSGSD